MRHELTVLAAGVLLAAVLLTAGGCSSSTVSGEEWDRLDVASAETQGMMMGEVESVASRPPALLDEVVVVAPGPGFVLEEVVTRARRPVHADGRFRAGIENATSGPAGI